MHESRTGEFLDDNYVSEDDSDGDVDLEDDPECSTIRLTNIEKRVLQQPWKFTVILKVLGRSIGYAVLSDGPWMVAGHYLTVRQWRPNFDPDLAQIEKAMVWVCVPNLPVEFYSHAFLWRLGQRIGVPIRINDTTLCVSHGKFARMRVEVDLSKPLVSKFKF
ncbi:hypothetical protein P3X46_034238 [Hevea brasiliensis]|uniref:DUF4283 domain-containing protein n=1 Tax=Hevea brasiliensis TaxID=3981 RepID=A0ABQ9KBS2_HEVBR|nr:hypothetical protein P3X46_034238 [Hevea brasiliensis]